MAMAMPMPHVLLRWAVLAAALAATVPHCSAQGPIKHSAGQQQHSSSGPAASATGGGPSDTSPAAAAIAGDGPHGLQQRRLLSLQQQQCRNGTQRCGSRCVRLTDPAACGPACTRCPKPAANGVATCSGKGMCGVSCAKGYERAAAPGQAAAVECRLCGDNTFKAEAGPGPCSPCPEGSRTFGNTASDHDEPRDCYAGGLIPSIRTTGATLQALLDFEDQLQWSLTNTGPKNGKPRPGKGGSNTRVCLFACDGVPGVDVSTSVHVAHIAGSPAVYASNDPSLVRSGVNLVSAIRDQHSCGTCVSHAIASAAETAWAAAMRIDARGLNISHSFSYFCATYFTRVAGGRRSCATGWDLTQALDAMKAAPAAFFMNSSCLPPGVDPAAQLPDAQIKALCTAKVPAGCKQAGFTCDYTAVSDGFSQIQRYIRKHGSVVTRVLVTDNFMSFFKSNPTGVFNDSLSTDEQGIPHAVQLLGYNNEEKVWLAKNSWGSDWADEGMFRIAYGAAQVGHPENTYVLVDCWTDSTEDPSSLAAWSDKWPVIADEALPDCVLYTATASDTISGIADHFEVDILAFIADNTERGVISTLELGNPPRPEPQLQPATSWAGTVFRVCGIPPDIYDRVATDPCTADPASYCNGRQSSCAAGRCVCHEGYGGRLCEQDAGIEHNFILVQGDSFVLHLEPPRTWMDAQQRCERDGMRLACLYNSVHAAEVYRQLLLRFTSDRRIWIGLNDRQTEGSFAWVGGNSSSAASETPADFDLWLTDQPTDNDGEHCTYVRTDYLAFTVPHNNFGSWTVHQCEAPDITGSFLCGPVADSSDPCVRFPCSSAGTRPAVGCVAGGNSSNSVNGRECLCDAGLSYVSDELGCVEPAEFDLVEFQVAGVAHAFFVSPSASWTEADRICRARGMNLVKINSKEHAQQLQRNVVSALEGRPSIPEDTNYFRYWIGLNDRETEGRFVWSKDGTLLDFSAFPQDEPSDSCPLWVDTDNCIVKEREDCVMAWKRQGAWNDGDCGENFRFVCSD